MKGTQLTQLSAIESLAGYGQYLRLAHSLYVMRITRECLGIKHCGMLEIRKLSKQKTLHGKA